MTENAENAETTAKVSKKRVTKKATTKKAATKKAATKKAATKRTTETATAAETPKRRGRPPGKKTARKTTTRRTKKAAKQYAYLLLTPGENGTTTASAISGPFSTDTDALDDASLMADENTTIVLFREAKRGRVQRTTKFVAGR